MKLDRYKNHDVEVVIDKLVVTDKDDTRLKNSVATAMRQGDGLLMILDAQTDSVRHYSKRLMSSRCALYVTGLSYRGTGGGKDARLKNNCHAFLQTDCASKRLMCPVTGLSYREPACTKGRGWSARLILTR